MPIRNQGVLKISSYKKLTFLTNIRKHQHRTSNPNVENYINKLSNNVDMDGEKRYFNQFLGKKVVSKTGKEFGVISNMTFDVKTGEILQLVLKGTTGYCEGLDLERTKSGGVLIPYSAIAAFGDFVVVAEEDLI